MLDSNNTLTEILHWKHNQRVKSGRGLLGKPILSRYHWLKWKSLDISQQSVYSYIAKRATAMKRANKIKDDYPPSILK